LHERVQQLQSHGVDVGVIIHLRNLGQSCSGTGAHDVMKTSPVRGHSPQEAFGARSERVGRRLRAGTFVR
jgi:hypothetical protein